MYVQLQHVCISGKLNKHLYTHTHTQTHTHTHTYTQTHTHIHTQTHTHTYIHTHAQTHTYTFRLYLLFIYTLVSSWAKRRETLDRQEAELLSRVRSLRQRVIQQSSLHSGDVSSRNTSHSIEPPNSVVTHTTDHNT